MYYSIRGRSLWFSYTHYTACNFILYDVFLSIYKRISDYFHLLCIPAWQCIMHSALMPSPNSSFLWRKLNNLLQKILSSLFPSRSTSCDWANILLYTVYDVPYTIVQKIRSRLKISIYEINANLSYFWKIKMLL